jgi:hypothetical protein
MKNLLNQLAIYFYLKKRPPGSVRNINVKLMHGMNRISILLFLVAAIVIIIRLFF